MDNDQLPAGTLSNNLASSSADVSNSLDNNRGGEGTSGDEHEALTKIEGHSNGNAREEYPLGATNATVDNVDTADRDHVHGKAPAAVKAEAEESVSEAKEKAENLGEEAEENEATTKSVVDNADNTTDAAPGNVAGEKKESVSGEAKDKDNHCEEKEKNEQAAATKSALDNDDTTEEESVREAKDKRNHFNEENDEQEATTKSALDNDDTPENRDHAHGEAGTAEIEGESVHEANEQGNHSEKRKAAVEDDLAGEAEEEEGPECRVCRGDDEGGTRPLANPCACSGSIKYVHQVKYTLFLGGWGRAKKYSVRAPQQDSPY